MPVRTKRKNGGFVGRIRGFKAALVSHLVCVQLAGGGLGQFAQRDKWIFCLTAAIVAA